jgi:myo-inositol-1(or 4)-monophosphatase
VPEIDRLLATCASAARAGGKQLLAWRGRFSTRSKGDRDFVTDADLASQEVIRAVVTEEFPDHGFLGEESPDRSQLDRPYCWVVDPLDGTTNYIHDFPFYSVSVAVARQGRAVAGAVFDPLRDELFLAEAGKGATLNGESIEPAGGTELAESLLAMSFPPKMELETPDMKAFLQVAPLCQAIRRTGSAALNLAYVACGRLDGNWAFDIYPWDSAAGVLLVEEAGGVATACLQDEYDLSKGNYLATSTPELHRALRPLMISSVQ